MGGQQEFLERSLFPTFACTFITVYVLKSKDEVRCSPEDMSVRILGPGSQCVPVSEGPKCILSTGLWEGVGWILIYRAKPPLLLVDGGTHL